MKNYLSEIIINKEREVSLQKEIIPIKKLENMEYFSSPVVSLTKYILRKDKSGIIAEIKRRSPSKGIINNYINVEKLSIAYMQAGASALSVLTDNKFFGGSLDDLITARRNNFCPILRKDFIIDEYQLYESRGHGADAILLIAEVLDKKNLEKLLNKARDLSLGVLIEVASKEDISKLPKKLDQETLIGINNRNLKDFTEKLKKSFELYKFLPKDTVKISESSIQLPIEVKELKKVGFQGFLIGERFMRFSDPALECKKFIEELKR